tara:strand:- start:619 stop:942 length:324 start_codon:yes stop_codon:yes gene_type:complete
MKNLGNLMKQAQQMQEKMQAVQERLETAEVTGSAGAGLLTVTMNGKGELRGVKIDPSLVDPAETEVLEDLIVAAFADAKSKVDTQANEAMQEVAGGLSLPPGMKLPF